MRNSQRAVVAALGVVVVTILGVATWVRLSTQAAPELSGQRSSRTYDLMGFDGVSVTRNQATNQQNSGSTKKYAA